MTAYRLAPEAAADLQDIRRYLVEQGGPPLARHILRELREAMKMLAASPGAGHRRPDLTEEPVRVWTVYSYLVVYDPATTPLGVARVLHGARDLEAIFQSKPPRA